MIALQRPEVPQEPCPRGRVLVELSNIHKIRVPVLHGGRCVEPRIYAQLMDMDWRLARVRDFRLLVLRDVRMPHQRR